MDYREPLISRGAGSPSMRPPPPPPIGGEHALFRVTKCPSDTLAFTNRLIVAPRDFPPQCEYVRVATPAASFVFSIRPDQGIPAGHIGTGLFQRRWAALSLNQEVEVTPFDPASSGYSDYMLGIVDAEVGFVRKGVAAPEPFETNEMAATFCTSFAHQYFTVGQPLLFDFHGHSLTVTITGLFSASYDQQRPEQRITSGILLPESSVRFSKAHDSSIILKGVKSMKATTIITPDFKFEDMGIGGLDSEFGSIFRRAFASRIFPPALVEKLGIQHVKGIILFGPPGTGKTLMARQIGKMLNAREPKIVNGPEILNKFVGQSEENIRKLFADAEKEYKEKGDESDLHIIIFDELDAICKQRGAKNDGTGVGDSVVNQLLSKMDGVDQLNNILVIGMTNRLDMIDEALLRPGRLEVHMEISLPDEHGRMQILKIHTAKMRDNGIMGEDVDLEELATLTKNYSGAEINGLVKSASSFAFNRHVKVGAMADVAPDVEDMQVMRDDFLLALDEVRPDFGVSDEELSGCVSNGIIHFGEHIERILQDGQMLIEQVKTSARTPLVSVLLHGPTGSGKSALAATIAMSSEFPFIKLISPDTMVGYTEASKVAAINKVFTDSYKSPMSVIVVDEIERLLDWVPIGPRFSNGVLQALMVLLKRRPPKGHRLLILASTTRRSILSEMDLDATFDSDIPIPNVRSLHGLDAVLRDVHLFDNEGQRAHVLHRLREGGMERSMNVGIKRLLMACELARQDVDKEDKFVRTLLSANGLPVV